jgi:pseudouridine-5'-phosphate glycosidase
MPHPLLELAPEVQAALSAHRPVVALESTIITHGMPWPANLETARALEAEVRAGGAVPATIAVLDGKLAIGLTDARLEALARSPDAIKCSRRDLGVVLARGQTGATTVAGTLIAAHLAGIRVFVTGGIGGVHRGATMTMDVSADLLEIARTPVAVVCAGVKSILDVALTLEVLETHGVPVIGYGTERFPAFYVRDGGHPVAARCDHPAELAAVLAMHWALGLGGAVVANPIPAGDELPANEIERAIVQALAEAHSQGVTGKDITPFLLQRLEAITEGGSLKANIALVMNNARVGAALAAALVARAEKLS